MDRGEPSPQRPAAPLLAERLRRDPREFGGALRVPAEPRWPGACLQLPGRRLRQPIPVFRPPPPHRCPTRPTRAMACRWARARWSCSRSGTRATSRRSPLRRRPVWWRSGRSGPASYGETAGSPWSCPSRTAAARWARHSPIPTARSTRSTTCRLRSSDGLPPWQPAAPGPAAAPAVVSSPSNAPRSGPSTTIRTGPWECRSPRAGHTRCTSGPSATGCAALPTSRRARRVRWPARCTSSWNATTASSGSSCRT